MLTFDKLKIVTKLEYIKIEDEYAFEKIVRGDILSSLKYHLPQPSLYIEIDYIENELVIEFSGKILFHRYKELISLNTIRECFENINSLGVCTLNIDAILLDAEVVKCDVTKDVRCDKVTEMSSFIRSNIRNYNQYIVKKLRNGNLTIEKNVTSRQYKKRLTMYDKSREMNRQENRRYMERYDIPITDFDNLCRFEINLNSVAQIKSALGVADTKLMTVLEATTNPIADFLDDVITDGEVIPLTDKQSYLTELVLRDCNYDIAMVEAKMRQLHSKGTNISKVMKPYRDALTNSSTPRFTKRDLLQMVQ